MEKEEITTETAAHISASKDAGYSSEASSLKDLRSVGIDTTSLQRQEAMVNENMYPSNRSNHSFLQECENFISSLELGTSSPIARLARNDKWKKNENILDKAIYGRDQIDDMLLEELENYLLNE